MASYLPIQGSEQSKEKTKTTNQSKQLPKDAQVIISILRWDFNTKNMIFNVYKIIWYFLRDIGVNDFEPRIINQLLEFTYRYVTTILDDAK